MALIKTISEIRAVLPRISSLSNTASLPNVDKAAWKYLVPIIGQPLYDDLNTKYNAQEGATVPKEQLLVKMLQLPLAAYALYDEMAFIHASITDNGIRTTSTAQMQTAHKWEYNELKNALLEAALDGTEMVLAYLFGNVADFPLWSNSEAYRTQNSLLIKSSAEFSKQYKLFQPQRTYFLLTSIMADVEENYLISRLGRTMLAFIKSSPVIKTIAAGSEVDVTALLKKAVAFITIKTACEHLQVEFSNSGFSVLASGGNSNSDSEGRSQANYADLNSKMDAANRDGQNYLSKVAYYLQGMGEGAFPQTLGPEFLAAYVESPLYIDPTIENVAITNGNDKRRIFVL